MDLDSDREAHTAGFSRSTPSDGSVAQVSPLAPGYPQSSATKRKIQAVIEASTSQHAKRRRKASNNKNVKEGVYVLLA